jgi:uncharacterized membrane protein YccC
MVDSESFKRLVSSQYFFSGLEAGLGVALVTLASYYGLGVSAALGAAVGAVCVSIVDLPNPPHHKFYQAMAAAIFGTLVMLVMEATSHDVWTRGLAVLAISFFAALLQSYGRQVLALSFSLLFVMVIALGTPAVDQIGMIDRIAFFALGALAYVAYGVVASRVLAFKTKQQSLGESMYVLANYLRVRSRFYEPGVDLDACYRALIEEQMVVVEKQQATRELVLRRVRSPRDVRLVALLLGTLDVYEKIFSSSTDYELLQERFAGSDAMLFLRDLAEKGAQDLEGLAASVVGRRVPSKKISYKAEQMALEYEMERLARAASASEADQHSLAVLRGVCDRILHGIAQIQELHALSASTLTRAELLGGESLRPFVTSFSFSPGVLRAQLKARSAILRFAVRLSAAMGSGYVLAHVLPYATHSYWILLTIAVVLRSSYSQTQQRRNDRIIGTALGGVVTALLLHFGPPSWLQMLILFAALGTAHTFATIKYRYTAIAASVMALLQVHLMNPSAAFALPERIIDTLVGALLAFAFSFLWPSWERQSIPQQIRNLLEANLRYVEAVLSMTTADLEYRLARKRLFDSIATLTGSLQRMLNEPKSHHRAVRELHEFITLDYLLAAHAAAAHLLLEHRAAEMDPGKAAAELASSVTVIREHLEQARLAWERSLRAAPDPLEIATRMSAAEAYSEPHLTPATLLKRRLRLIEETAATLTGLCARISAQW